MYFTNDLYFELAVLNIYLLNVFFQIKPCRMYEPKLRIVLRYFLLFYTYKIHSSFYQNDYVFSSFCKCI